MRGLRFDEPVVPGGYRWWYVDGVADDGRCGITLIGFVGSVFSPYYARARRRGAADPLDHVALNVALYGDTRRWSMTERGRGSLHRDATTLAIGPSSMRWDGDRLCVDIDEVALPWPSRLRGRIRLFPSAIGRRALVLDVEGRHRWQPIAAHARIEVEMESPSLRWSGRAYMDTNDGDAPPERSFSGWHWSRSCDGDATDVLYDVDRFGAEPLSLALRIDRDGGIEHFEPPPPAALPGTGWRIARSTRSDPQQAPRVLRTLEDTPFYARSLVSARFGATWVQTLLPFKMPRRAG